MEDNDINKIPQEGIGIPEASLDLTSIDDRIFADYIDKRIKISEDYYKDDKNLYVRQKRNEDYLFGRQLDLDKLKTYQAKYIDNIIYEAESTIKPIAMSRLPDLYVTSGTGDPSGENNKKLTDLVNSEIRKREQRRALAVAFKHIPVGFIGAIKHRFNPSKGKYGDYEFFPIHFSRLTLDHSAKSNDTNDMDFIREVVPMSVQELVMKFPDKKDELFGELRYSSEDEKNKNKMATKVDVSEIWFKWYEDIEGGKHRLISGVAWKYKKVVLKKMKNPNWDWEGDQIDFKFDEQQKDKKSPTAEDYKIQALGGDMGIQTETKYSNYLEQPEFPYILLGYDQFATMPYDETSRIEQVILLQDNVNKRGRQITEIADRARGRHFFSSESGLKKEDIEELDLDDANVDVWMDKIAGHKFEPGEQPGAALFNDQEMNRQRIFQKMGVNSTTRGQKETDVATTAQILRESDFGRIDDIVEDTINYAAEKMAKAIMQYIKLRYTEEHFKHIMGKDGQTIYERITNDMIEDGMEVIVHASGVDKMRRKQEAFEKAKLKLTDPLTFFEDTDSPNPKDRAERLFMFSTDPAGYFAKYIKGLTDTPAMANALNGAPVAPSPAVPGQLPVPGQPMPQGQPQQANGQQEALQAIGQLQQGQMPQPPMQMTPEYIQTMDAFLNSPQFQAMQDNIKQMVIQFAQNLTQGVQ